MSDDDFIVNESATVMVEGPCRFPVTFGPERITVHCENCNAGVRLSRVGDGAVDGRTIANQINAFADAHTPCPFPRVETFKVTL